MPLAQGGPARLHCCSWCWFQLQRCSRRHKERISDVEQSCWLQGQVGHKTFRYGNPWKRRKVLRSQRARCSAANASCINWSSFALIYSVPPAQASSLDHLHQRLNDFHGLSRPLVFNIFPEKRVASSVACRMAAMKSHVDRSVATPPVQPSRAASCFPDTRPPHSKPSSDS